ncbi:MAG: DUF4430 domain-containing protein [Eggerthellaceae bacterium]
MSRTSNRNRARNIAMVALAAVIVVAGILFVLDMRGIVDFNAAATPYTTEAKEGDANIQRAGVTYQLDEGAGLRQDDQVETLADSSIAVTGDGKGRVALDAETKLSVQADGLRLDEGGLFCRAQSGQTLSLSTVQTSLTASDALFVLTAETGSTQILMLAGKLSLADGTELSAGQAAVFTEGQDKPQIRSSFGAAQLDDFMLEQAQQVIEEGTSLSLGTKAIKKAEKKRAQAKAAGAAKKRGTVSTDKAQGNGSSDASSDTSGSDTVSSDTKSGSSGKSASAASSSPAKAKKKKSAGAGQVTIQIRCDTILHHKKNLAAGKSKYVPANGVILGTTTVTFAKGDTVLDVLKAACRSAGIPLEYQYAPVYDSYYIEGVNNLYEKDCGEQSGWVYQVNGWTPNVGCSQYKVSDGDAIVWAYSCENYGEDV